MTPQKCMAAALLVCGAAYALCLCRGAWKNRAAFRAEPGVLWNMSLWEAAVYFFTTMGFPDFLLNTVLFRHKKWVDDRRLPGTLVAASILPGAWIASAYLLGNTAVDLITLLLCVAAIGLGSIIGARVVSRMSGGAIRAIMGVAMIASMGALILKMIVSAGAVGTAMDLSAWKLFIALPLMFGFGVINMFGVPMKPPAIALLLLLGMEPMAVLTVVMVMGVVSPMTGGVRVLRSGNYQRKPVLAGALAGFAGALAGTVFTVSLNAAVLNGILLFIMAFTAVSMLRPQRGAARPAEAPSDQEEAQHESHQ